MEFHDDEYDVSCGLKIDGQMDEFLSNLKSLPRDRNGNIMLSDLSSIRIPDENNLIDKMALFDASYPVYGLLIMNIKIC